MIKKLFLCAVGLTILSISATAFSAQPLDEIRGPIDGIIQILRDPQYKSDAQKAEQREKIWVLVDRFFDFREISRRTLSKFWKKFTPAQQEEFVAVFSEFLSNIYLDRIQGEYKNEKVEFIGQSMLTKTKASVKTKVIREGNIEIPVDYNLRQKDKTWKVYDVIIEGVSLVKNYRTQFRGILLKKKPDQLIDTLKKKNAKQKEKHSKAGIDSFELRFISQRALLAVWFDSGRLEYHIK